MRALKFISIRDQRRSLDKAVGTSESFMLLKHAASWHYYHRVKFDTLIWCDTWCDTAIILLKRDHGADALDELRKCTIMQFVEGRPHLFSSCEDLTMYQVLSSYNVKEVDV